jgi:hypothetical protein
MISVKPHLHRGMISWPGVRSLEIKPGDMAMLDILRRPDVTVHLAQWNAGRALGEDTVRRRTTSIDTEPPQA